MIEGATSLLEQVTEKIADGDAKSAVKLMSKMPAAAKSDGVFAAKYEEVAKKVDAAADGLLAEVDPLIKSKHYVEASAKLKELSDALGSSSVGAKARLKLSDLMGRPEVKAAVSNAEKNAKANAALEVAQKLQTEKKDTLAYPRFKEIVAQFPGTAAAVTASDSVKTYEADTEFMSRLKNSAVAVKAKAALSMADNYRKAGRDEDARAKYQQVVDDYPGTSFADVAQRALTELAKQ